jgi:hypothetical protein
MRIVTRMTDETTRPDPDKIETPLGAVIRLVPAPENLAPGVMLMLGMADPRDDREAEVYLDPLACSELRDALDRHA